MGKQVALWVTLVLGAVVVAGCLGGDEQAPVRSFEASSGQVSDGYAYDGQGLEAGAAQLTGWVDHEENTGNVTASFEFAGSQWNVYHDAFSGAEDWKEGGVAFGLVEHGDTGTSTTIIPRIDGDVVTYGTATVHRDGQGVGDGRWDAHLMLSSTTVRGEDGMITKEDGSTPYDPATPEDARVLEDDPQALLQLTAPHGADSARPAEFTNGTVQVTGADSSETVELGGGPRGSITVNVTTTGGDVPLQAGDLQVRLLDEDGNALDEDSGDVLGEESFETTLSASGLNSTVTLEVTGNGVYDVEFESQVVFDDHPFIIVTWDDYTLEEAETAPAS